MPEYIVYVNVKHAELVTKAILSLHQYLDDHPDFQYMVNNTNLNGFEDCGILIGPEQAFVTVHRHIELANAIEAGKPDNPFAEIMTVMDGLGVSHLRGIFDGGRLFVRYVPHQENDA